MSFGEPWQRDRAVAGTRRGPCCALIRHMSTHTITTHADPCPGCDQADRIYWVTGTPVTDIWAWRHCGTEWTITVQVAGR